MRVAVVAEWYPSPADPVHGVWAHRQAVAARDAGAEVRVLALRRPVPPLTALRRGGLDAWRRGVPATLRPFVLDGLTVEPVPFLAPPRPWSYGAWGHWAAPPLAAALTRLWRRWPFDVVHAHSIVPPGFAAAWWGGRGRLDARGDRAAAAAVARLVEDDGLDGSAPLARRGRPAVVVSTHGPDVIHVARRSALAHRATRSTLRAVDLLVANSRWAAQRCEELAGEPVPTRVVHFGADTPAAPPVKHARPTLVTVAHLQARKRHAVVLHALAELFPRLRPDYVIVGDGPGRGPLEALARRLGVADQVRFLGQLPHPAALAEAWRCHLLVMPSVEEPFGVAYVEAMAGGLPAVGARGEGGPEDIAAAGEGMLLVPPDDHRAVAGTVEALLGDPGRLAALGAAARRTVERSFTWQRCGKATLGAYEAALERR